MFSECVGNEALVSYPSSYLSEVENNNTIQYNHYVTQKAMIEID